MIENFTEYDKGTSESEYINIYLFLLDCDSYTCCQCLIKCPLAFNYAYNVYSECAFIKLSPFVFHWRCLKTRKTNFIIVHVFHWEHLIPFYSNDVFFFKLVFFAVRKIIIKLANQAILSWNKTLVFHSCIKTYLSKFTRSPLLISFGLCRTDHENALDSSSATMRYSVPSPWLHTPT